MNLFFFIIKFNIISFSFSFLFKFTYKFIIIINKKNIKFIYQNVIQKKYKKHNKKIRLFRS